MRGCWGDWFVVVECNRFCDAALRCTANRLPWAVTQKGGVRGQRHGVCLTPFCHLTLLGDLSLHTTHQKNIIQQNEHLAFSAGRRHTRAAEPGLLRANPGSDLGDTLPAVLDSLVCFQDIKCLIPLHLAIKGPSCPAVQVAPGI